MLVLYVTTYALSSTVLPVVRRAKVPVMVLNLQPAAAIDYARFNRLADRTAMTGEWLAFCQACPVPEIANVFNRAGIPFFQVTGLLEDDPACWHEIEEWIAAAAGVAASWSTTAMGVMGHYYGGMLDIYSDLTRQCAWFGGHIEMIEVDELAALRSEMTSAEIAERVCEISDAFDVQPDCSADELERAARTSMALDRLVDSHKLGSLAYFYSGTGNPANEDTISSIILGNSPSHRARHSGRRGVEIKNVQAMKIMDALRRRRIVHRILRHGLQRRRGVDGPRWSRPYRHRRRQDQGPAARGLSRQSRARTLGGDERKARPGDAALRGRRRATERCKLLVAEGESVPARFWRSGTPTAAIASPSARADLSSAGTSRPRRTTAQWVWAT